MHDNHGLFRALNSSYKVLPIFIFDKNILGSITDKKDKRVLFIFQTLKEIHELLMKHGSSLRILHDDPLNAFKTIFEEFDVKAVFTNHDYEPYAMERDKKVNELLQERNISFYTYKDQVIFEKDEVVKNDGSPYTVFTPYSKIWKQKLANEGLNTYDSENGFSKFYRGDSFSFPIISSLGFEETKCDFPKKDIKKERIKNYHLRRNFPAVEGCSNLSLHLRFGTVSVRALCKLALDLNEQWLNELIWREFFMMILYHFPNVVNTSFKKKYDNIVWRNDEKEFEKWCKGETGYPLVDAGMRELNETGLMHNRVRMLVASFLTKHLLIDWRWGEAYFAEKLLDYELSSNNGNWQWAAGCGCDAAPYFRIFNPTEQAKKFDPEYDYIKKWIPNFSLNYLEPIVEHTFARKRALETYKNAVQEKL